MKKILLPMMLVSWSCSPSVEQQKTDDVNPVKERFAKMEADALKESYLGIFSKTDTLEDLFPIKSTNVSTAPIVEAANQFLNGLESEQLNRTRYVINDNEWR